MGAAHPRLERGLIKLHLVKGSQPLSSPKPRMSLYEDNAFQLDQETVKVSREQEGQMKLDKRYAIEGRVQKRLTKLSSFHHIARQNPVESGSDDLRRVAIDEADLTTLTDLGLVGFDVPLVKAWAGAVLELAVMVDDGAFSVPTVVRRLQATVGALDVYAELASEILLDGAPWLFPVYGLINDPKVLLLGVLLVDVRCLEKSASPPGGGWRGCSGLHWPALLGNYKARRGSHRGGNHLLGRGDVAVVPRVIGGW